MIPRLKFEYKITVIYLILGAGWIIFSDKLVEYFIQDKNTITHVQTYKGWFYVAFTAGILFLFLKKHLIRLRTAQKKAEEGDQLKTAFLRNISHEIRTPMNAIVGFSSLLNDPSVTFDKHLYYTNMIEQSSNHLLSIITDIINIATIESGQERVTENEINLNELLIQVHEQFILKTHEQNIEINSICSLSEKDAFVKVDRIKLTTILSNLIDNATKFTKEGSVNFGYTKKANTLEFYVEDSGIGISPDMHENIFNRFRQVECTTERQFGGSGLGLSISKAYVEMLGGKIWLKSELGKGSVFYFTIPYKKADNLELATKQLGFEIKNEIRTPKIIVVAEDEDLNFMLLNELLSDSDFTLLRALNGLEVVQLCKSPLHVDLILMDIKMPVMDGYEASKQIREIRPNLPIIAQTAYSTDIDKANAFSSGCSDFISKPFNKEQLIAKINNLLFTS